MIGGVARNLPHMPDSSPTAKQLASLLKATESTAVGLEDSMGGRTFILASRAEGLDVWSVACLAYVRQVKVQGSSERFD
jgi:hypothetical protein